MAKVGKLTKLKSAIKKWPSFTKNNNNNNTSSSSSSSAAVAVASVVVSDEVSTENNKDLHVVYVGKTRRVYMLRSDVISHPLFQQLVDRSSRNGNEEEIVVACEVVLFEHLLWILNTTTTSNSPVAATHQEGGSVEELAQFYTY